MYAAKENATACAELLVSRKADVYEKTEGQGEEYRYASDELGQTAEDLAEGNLNASLVDLLRNHRKDLTNPQFGA